MEREVLRCCHCHLNQFMTANEMCRRCRRNLRPQAVPVIEIPVPLAPTPRIVGRLRATPIERIPPVSVDFAFALRLVRLALDISQGELSRRMKAPRSYVSKLEHSYCSPLPRTVHRCAKALEIPADVLIAFACVPRGEEVAA